MSSTKLILALGALGVGVAYVLRKQSQATPTDGGPCDAICAAAQTQGIPPALCREGAAYRACKALGGLFEGWDDKDATNKALNGEVELELGPLGDRTVVVGAGELAEAAGNIAAVRPTKALMGTVARFKNGCVPFAGMPGYEKCKPGTFNMEPAGVHFTASPAKGGYVEQNDAAAFSGDAGDPFTQGPFTADRQHAMPGLGAPPASEPAFPLPLSSGETGYFFKGQPFKCPPGTAPQWNVHDQRTGGGPPPCAGPDGAGGFGNRPPPKLIGKGLTGPRSSESYDCSSVPPDRTWDPSNGGYWRRMNAGETQNLGPCAATPASSGRAALTAAPLAIGTVISSAGAGGSRT